jgi:hypothetical protein
MEAFGYAEKRKAPMITTITFRGERGQRLIVEVMLYARSEQRVRWMLSDLAYGSERVAGGAGDEDTAGEQVGGSRGCCFQ